MKKCPASKPQWFINAMATYKLKFLGNVKFY